MKKKKLLKQKDESAGDLFESLGQEAKKVLNVIIKTDVGGTCEAINSALFELGNEKAKVKIKLKKYNPVTRKHEYFVEKKLPPHSK